MEKTTHEKLRLKDKIDKKNIKLYKRVKKKKGPIERGCFENLIYSKVQTCPSTHLIITKNHRQMMKITLDQKLKILYANFKFLSFKGNFVFYCSKNYERPLYPHN